MTPSSQSSATLVHVERREEVFVRGPERRRGQRCVKMEQRRNARALETGVPEREPTLVAESHLVTRRPQTESVGSLDGRGSVSVRDFHPINPRWSVAGMQGEKTRQRAASSSTIPTCENPGANPTGIISSHYLEHNLAVITPWKHDPRLQFHCSDVAVILLDVWENSVANKKFHFVSASKKAGTGLVLDWVQMTECGKLVMIVQSSASALDLTDGDLESGQTPAGPQAIPPTVEFQQGRNPHGNRKRYFVFLRPLPPPPRMAHVSTLPSAELKERRAALLARRYLVATTGNEFSLAHSGAFRKPLRYSRRFHNLPKPRFHRSACSPPTKWEASRFNPRSGSRDFCKWESCRTMPFVGGFSRGSPVFPAPLIPALHRIHFNRPHRLSRPHS
ncbi:hypothetical protein PR048_005125 [Dryococelus australis]|uniref:Uncharacterized protein n=1 Tax=Dryococelus australis TaxID=614101 RepID=A0ABQ9I7B8_9NEOP|nr:hypothetical protein PR048_005125 [Dryococelus australis]